VQEGGNWNIEGKFIFQLKHDDGTIVGKSNLKNYIIEYCKKLFRVHDPNYLRKL
jgi:hypothetical protein